MAPQEPSLLFAVNGEKVALTASEVDPSVTLNDFIRRETKYSGTKLSCGEGGCGACAVDLSREDPRTGEIHHMSVNSCLRPLASMDGWNVTTTEGLGGPKKGFHPIQERIAGFNGLQCGFCTPGMVMTAYSTLAQADGDVTKEQMEKSFDGNLCRCTGYRPILDACKSLAKDTDIEDLVCGSSCPSYSSCSVPELNFPEFLSEHSTKPVTFERDGKRWIRPANLAQVFDLLKLPDSRLVVANTSTGIYKEDKASVLIDLQHIPELLECQQYSQTSITMGGSLSISKFIEGLEQVKNNSAPKSANVPYMEALIAHAQRIANIHVRNVGSIAGNLAMAKTQGFVSDLATILLGANATIKLQSEKGIRTCSMEEFLESTEWKGEILRSVVVPFFDDGEKFNTYKTAIRPVNSHALINAAFLAKIENNVIKHFRASFGGVQQADKPGSHAILAKKTAQYVLGKELNASTLLEALKILEDEIIVEGLYKAESRRKLIAGFFYKFYLSLLSGLAPRLQSASEDFFKTRPISTASQKFSFPESDFPVSSAVPKASGKSLAAGNALFIDDIPCQNSLFGALVTSSRARATIISIDATEALLFPGVIDFISSEHVEGKNNCSAFGEEYPIFAATDVEYYGQPIGMIVADTLRHAEAATKLVTIVYGENASPILTVVQAKEDEAFHFPIKNIYESGDVEEKLARAEKKASGEIFLASQKHFYMETQVCEAYVDEDNSFVIQSANQFPHAAHTTLASALGVAQNQVRLICRRAGGGFGGKLTHNLIVSCATAIACQKMQCRVRVALNRNIDMRLAGGREETTVRYEVGFNNDGTLEALKMHAELAGGSKKDLSFFCNTAFVNSFSQAYNLPSFLLHATTFKTNQAPRTAVRGPSEISSSWCMETILEHIAHDTGIPIQKIREMNFINEEEAKAGKKLPNGNALSHFTVPSLFKRISEVSNEEELRTSVSAFNAAHTFKKRGIAKTPVRYEVNVYPRSSLVNIFPDGSIIVHHTTADIGQGANTKVFQTVSQRLGTLFTPCKPVSLDCIRNSELDTNVSPNVTFTGGSTSSESSCEAAQKACDAILERLKPIVKGIAEEKEEKGEDVGDISWVDVCTEAAAKGIQLSALGYCEGGRYYQNYGGCLSMIELDTITGEVEILRTDLIYDCGKSLNPAIDVGQCEGAFVMGLGFLLREEVSFTEEGALVNDGTWEYKVPCYRDVPQVFNVELLNNAPFERGFLSSKASGEPPLVLANSVGFAVRQAIKAARLENGLADEFFILNTPLTVDAIQNACGSPHFTLQ